MLETQPFDYKECRNNGLKLPDGQFELNPETFFSESNVSDLCGLIKAEKTEKETILNVSKTTQPSTKKHQRKRNNRQRAPKSKEFKYDDDHEDQADEKSELENQKIQAKPSKILKKPKSMIL